MTNSPHNGHTLEAQHVRLAYDHMVVADDLSLVVPAGKITCIVGANACGKSTLLRALARLLRPQCGEVLLDGRAIHRLPTKEVATRLGILPQSPIAPDGITVADLVGRGRYPHQRWLQQWSPGDEDALTSAMVLTGTLDLASRSVDELSGGQRQRVWIAMTLAQGTPLMLLDEPTTFLDLAHQVEVLDLLVDLNQREGRTDRARAPRSQPGSPVQPSSDRAQTRPCRRGWQRAAVITEEMVADVFDLRCRVMEDPVSGTPMVRRSAVTWMSEQRRPRAGRLPSRSCNSLRGWLRPARR